MRYSDLPQVISDRDHPEVVYPQHPTYYPQKSDLPQVVSNQDDPANKDRVPALRGVGHRTRPVQWSVEGNSRTTAFVAGPA